MFNNILIFCLTIILGMLTYHVDKISNSVKELNDKLAGAEIRIDICLNEQAMLQDNIESQIALVKFDVEGIKEIIGFMSIPAPVK